MYKQLLYLSEPLMYKQLLYPSNLVKYRKRDGLSARSVFVVLCAIQHIAIHAIQHIGTICGSVRRQGPTIRDPRPRPLVVAGPRARIARTGLGGLARRQGRFDLGTGFKKSTSGLAKFFGP